MVTCVKTIGIAHLIIVLRIIAMETWIKMKSAMKMKIVKGWFAIKTFVVKIIIMDKNA